MLLSVLIVLIATVVLILQEFLKMRLIKMIMKIVKISKKLITGTYTHKTLPLFGITKVASTNCFSVDCCDCTFTVICDVTRRLIQKS